MADRVRCCGWGTICCLFLTGCGDSGTARTSGAKKPEAKAPADQNAPVENALRGGSRPTNGSSNESASVQTALDDIPQSAHGSSDEDTSVGNSLRGVPRAANRGEPAPSVNAAEGPADGGRSPTDARAPEVSGADQPADKVDEPPADDSDTSPSLPDKELFAGWPKPEVVLVFTGEQAGYIEPCGCAGLEKQKGGLRRRHTFLKQLHERGWPVVALDNGGIIGRFGREAEIKFDKAVEALRIMGYQAVGFGAEDLKLPTGAVTATTANGEVFVSANVGLFGFDSGFVPRLRVIEAGRLKLGVTAVLGDSLQQQLTNDEVQLMPAEKAISQVLPDLKKAQCDRLVLLAYAKPEESRELAEKFPDFDVVVTAHGAEEPPHEAQRVNGDGAQFVEVGHKGMYAIVLGLYDDETTPVRYQRVPLDHRFADSPEMDELMVSYQDQLKDLGWEGLGLRRGEHPRGKFAGSDQCADCHQRAFEIWRDTPHALATETLAKAKPPRQFDPECISCHATGWNAQKYLPYTTGYDSLEKTPALAGNGCENCHGPGAAHVAAEMAGDEKLQEKLRDAMRLSLDGDDGEAQRRSCLECHDGDNSPDFDFDTYWPKIAHP